MRKKITVLGCLLFFGFMSFTQTNKYTSLKQMKWLAGSWKGMYKGSPFYESWIMVNDSFLVNLSIEIKNNDTLVKENGFTRLQNGNIIHSGTDATWQLSKLSDTEMIFENDTLKFANRIIWSHSPNDHWITVIHNPSGVINYDLERVPWLDKVVDKFIRKAKN